MTGQGGGGPAYGADRGAGGGADPAGGADRVGPEAAGGAGAAERLARAALTRVLEPGDERGGGGCGSAARSGCGGASRTRPGRRSGCAA